MNLKAKNLFLFDLDGVLSIGKAKPRYVGGREVISILRSKSKRVAVLTNDTTNTSRQIYRNLSKMGFELTVNEILTSAYLTSRYLTSRYGKTSFYLLGEGGLRSELRAEGHKERRASPDVVVVGLDRHLTYGKLNHAVRLLRRGAGLVACYGGAMYMSGRGPALSAGAIVKALEYASGRKATVIGKPSSLMFKLALKRTGDEPESAVMIGDQLETDILGAHRAGIEGILVLTGVESEDTMRASKIRADLVLKSVNELADLI